MAIKPKYEDVVSYVDGVKITMCAPRMPRKAEKTFDISKSRYTAWHQGVSNYTRGSHGCLGTVRSTNEK
jgi:hypothetical protein